MSNPLAVEFQKAQTSAVCFELPGRTQIELTGTDRQKFLHNFCTNDINKLQPGQACEAFVTNVQGKVLGHIFVFAAPDSLWIETVPHVGEQLFGHLDRYLITEDVELTDRTDEFDEFYVTGPTAANLLSEAGFEVTDMEPITHQIFPFGESIAVIHRVDWFGAPGYLISVEKNTSNTLREKLPLSEPELFEALRILARFPHYGIDITEENLAQEIGRTESAISFTKGCYLGQEPIARIDSMGHVNRELKLLNCEAGPVPAAGAVILSADSEKEAGRVTSATLHPETDQPIALGYVSRGSAKPGTKLTVQANGTSIAAIVAE